MTERNEGLREQARHLFSLGLAAADPAQALGKALKEAAFPLPDPGGRQRVIAFGKAALAMAGEAQKHLLPGAELLVVTNYENAEGAALPGAQIFASGHPVPDDNGLRAGAAVAEVLRAAGAADRVIALISGGGSALLPAPLPGLSLADKAAVNRLLLAGGFDITEMNLVRQSLSQLKGGGMLRLAAPAPVSAYILSDVIGDDLRVIASGPTVSPLGDRAKAAALLEAAGLWSDLPARVQELLAEPAEPAARLPEARNLLIGSNPHSLSAVAAGAGADVAQMEAALTGDVAAAASALIRAARAARDQGFKGLICGGETTVVLRGKGLGGRNQELALRLALAAEASGFGAPWVFLSGGTDGRDGPTDAAGGLTDGSSLARMRAAGVDPAAALAENDSYHALKASGDLLVTGATGTNVADLQIMLWQ